ADHPRRQCSCSRGPGCDGVTEETLPEARIKVPGLREHHGPRQARLPPRHRDTGILDSLGRFFGADRGAPKRGSGKDGHHAARTTHYGSLPQKAQHGRPQDENPVVHFFKNIVSVPFPRCLAGRGRCPLFLQGAEGQKPGFGYGGRAPDYKPAHKGLKGAQDAQGTLSKIFKLGGRDSRSGSPMMAQLRTDGRGLAQPRGGMVVTASAKVTGGVLSGGAHGKY
uniref:Myelin basic protein n=1 Tax=Sus scrofa TaxID=9823 RepID=A0A8W4FKI9_PIG